MIRQFIKLYLPIVALLTVLSWSSVSTARNGLSRLMAEFGSATSSLRASQRSLELNPSDADAHHLSATLSADNGDLVNAIDQAQQAVKLRPGDYFLWFELGRLQDEHGDLRDAIVSLRRATQLAPHYAQPHWLLGNVLLRNDETDAALEEMKRASRTEPTFFLQTIELAWVLFESDASRTNEALRPQTKFEQITLARFFINHNEVQRGVELLYNLTDLATEERRAIVTDLLALNEFELARSLFGSCIKSGLCNSGFEEAILTNEDGFGWQTTKLVQVAKVLADSTQPAEGTRSLRVEYSGNFDETTPVIAQLVPVEVNKRYRLSWKLSTQELASAGLPVISVSDVLNSLELKRSQPIQKGNSTWTDYTVEFETGSNTKAVKIALQRESCNIKPCPITGRLWLDQFSLVSY